MLVPPVFANHATAGNHHMEFWLRRVSAAAGSRGCNPNPTAALAALCAACCPQWDQPVPAEWESGGGWGQQPMVLMAGLE